MNREDRITSFLVGIVVGYLIMSWINDMIEDSRWHSFRAAFDAPTVEGVET